MVKKIVLLIFMAVFTLTANAQFEKGKTYIGASLSGLNLSYNGSDHTTLGVQAQAGYLVDDNLMLTAQAKYNHTGTSGVADYFSAGVGGRYYIIQNGLYLGINCKFVHAYDSYNDLMPGVEVGYAYFLNKSVTIEPAIYYDQSFKNHSDYSTIGFKIGIGIYL